MDGTTAALLAAEVSLSGHPATMLHPLRVFPGLIISSPARDSASSNEAVMTEADTCRKFVVPLLQKVGWDNDPHSIAEQRYFTAGRIISHGSTARRRPGKRADYLLRYTRDLPLAVVEATAAYKHPADGLQQAKDYASTLALPFAYATNGTGIIEFDFLTGTERELADFPTPADLWARYSHKQHLTDSAAVERFLAPFNLTTGKIPHYYQRIAIDRVIQAILSGRRRILVT